MWDAIVWFFMHPVVVGAFLSAALSAPVAGLVTLWIERKKKPDLQHRCGASAGRSPRPTAPAEVERDAVRSRRWTEAHGIRLAHLRIKAGVLDRRRPAVLVGETTIRIYNWEAALGRPDEAPLERLARVLNVKARELVA